MTDKFFVDTNLLVYAYDDSAVAKHTTALALVDEAVKGGTPVISTQVLQELVVCLRRKVVRPLDPKEIRKIVSELLQDWEVFVNTPESILRALEIEQRYQISFWDALILNAAQSSAASILYTEDLNDDQMYGNVRVKNPFETV
jgi:predicted nucleic acid-binding protein